ncbi:DUF1801 domain-containing protein [Chryseobacterium sp. cx-311]|uniref:DUF1801 domain-containing protein n=1 Tax=Marnyiella aurantia TaxID=2758037 RepID=UPI001AE77841|nr:DUF1801 domain-containing protein [Marnyiella aurantia]MBP0611441.1 DUF1801 domain-containing protein [Marnyiella aurantia]
MSYGNINLNEEVTTFLDQMHHPSRAGIDQLRNIILFASRSLTENIKWNGPNYSVGGEDRITMKIQPPTRPVKLIFHRGAKKKEQPEQRLIAHKSNLFDWRENDRAIMTFRNLHEIEDSKAELLEIIIKWIAAEG